MRRDEEREREAMRAILRIDGFMGLALEAGCDEQTWTNATLRDLWIAARSTHEAGLQIRRPTVEDDLRRLRKLESCGKAIEYFFKGREPNREAATADLPVLVKLARHRTLQAGLESARRRLEEGGLEDSLSAAENDLLDLTAIGAQATRTKTMQDLVLRFGTAFIDPRKRQGEDRLQPTYIAALDRILGGGLPFGEPVIVAARPGKGKTAFLKSLVLKLWRAKPKLHGMVFSAEMSAEALFERAMAEVMNKSSAALMHGDLLESDKDRVLEQLLYLRELRWQFDDRSKLSVGDVAARLREWVRSTWPGHSADNPPPADHPNGANGFVGIDYIQKLRPPSDLKRANRAEQVAAISEAIRLEAKRYPWLCVVVLAQLKRPTQEEAAMRLPTMDELRESGDIENDAAVILLLHRWGEVRSKRIAAFDPRHDQARWPGSCLGLLEKNRNGETGVCRLNFAANLTGFYDWDPPTCGDWPPGDMDPLPPDIADRVNPRKGRPAQRAA